MGTGGGAPAEDLPNDGGGGGGGRAIDGPEGAARAPLGGPVGVEGTGAGGAGGAGTGGGGVGAPVAVPWDASVAGVVVASSDAAPDHPR